MRATRIAIPLAALSAAVFIFGGLIRAADGNFPIYFPGSRLVVKAETFNRETYLPLKQILETMAIPYTDALALETLTIRSGNSRLVVTKNSALMSFNDQIVLLPSPVLREDGRWLVPIEFLNTGLARLTGTALTSSALLGPTPSVQRFADPRYLHHHGQSPAQGRDPEVRIAADVTVDGASLHHRVSAGHDRRADGGTGESRAAARTR